MNPDDQQRQEIENSSELVRRCVGSLFKLSPHQSAAYLSLVDERPDFLITSALRDVISAKPQAIKKKLGILRKLFEKYDGWVQKMNTDPNVRRVLNRSATTDELMQTLRSVGWESEEYVENDFTWTTLESMVIDVYHDLDAYEDGRSLFTLREFTAAVDKLLTESGKEVAHIYIQDLFTSLKIANPMGYPEIILTPITFSRLIWENPIMAMPVLQRLLHHTNDYLLLREESDRRMYSALREECEEPIDATELTGIAVLSIDAKNRRRVTNLLHAAENGQRTELLEYIVRDPNSLSLCKPLMKQGLTSEQFVGFILNHYDVSTTQGNFGCTVASILEKKSQGQTAVAMIQYATNYLTDPKRERIYSIATHNNQGHTILKEYFTARAAGEVHRADIYLTLGEQLLDASVLKAIRRSLNKIPEQVLSGWIDENIPSLLKKIRTYSGQNAVPKSPALKKLSWYDVLLSTVDGTEQQRVEAAYALLDGQRFKLRNLWKTQPRTVLRFCRDVEEFHDNSVYMNILSNRRLFSAYKQHLSRHGRKVRGLLRRDASIDDITYLLIQPTEHEESPVTDVDVVEKESLCAERVIIWGGIYSREALDAIETSVDLPVKVYDSCTRSGQLQSLKKGDVVVWMTTFSNHTAYYAVKSHCKSHKIPFYHCNKTGQSSVISMVRNLAA